MYCKKKTIFFGEELLTVLTNILPANFNYTSNI